MILLQIFTSRIRQVLSNLAARMLMLITSALVMTSNAQAEVMLHAFNWQYRQIGEQAAEIARLGYRQVLVMPPVKSVGGFWWARYQPQDYRTIDHPLGNKEDLAFAIKELAKYQVGVIADVVFNHMANESNARSDLNYPGEWVIGDYRSRRQYFERNKLYGNLDNNIFSSSDFNQIGCIRDYFNIVEVQLGRICGSGGDQGLPDLASSEWVIAKQNLYLESLKGMGIKGFRIDAAKHIPNEHLNAVFTDEILADTLVFGEIITYGGSDSVEFRLFLDPYLEATTHKAYDFPLLALLKRSIAGKGRLDSLVNPDLRGQALPAERAITVATTHDVANNQFDFFVMSPQEETLSYAYLLGTGQGSPLIYSESSDPGRPRWLNLHKRSDIVAMIRFYNSMQGEDLEYLHRSACSLIFRRGENGWVSINKCNTAQNARFNADDLAATGKQSFVNLLNPEERKILAGGEVTIQLPALSASMWLFEDQ